MSNIDIAKRKGFVGASEVPSLFSVDLREAGEKMYDTRYELWARKSELLAKTFKGNKRTRFGQYFEPAIGAAFRGEYGMKVHKVNRYLLHPTIDRMGASLDFEIVSHPLGRAPLEAKNVDEMIYRSWPEVEGADDPEFVKAAGLPLLRKRREPPLRLQLQLQSQIACSERSWGVLAICVGGNDIIPIPYPRVETTIRRIEEEVPLFWAEVDAGVPPPIDWSADARTVARLHGYADPLQVRNLRSDAEVLAMAREYKELGAEIGQRNDRRDVLKAQMLQRIGTASKAFLSDGYTILAPMVAGREISYFRDSCRMFRVNRRKRR